mmetsp:Transcript_3835/g.4246  ORF Transcript_3835/g.4246 Transcript_3835/m.4246 type:complete len:641 (+) Transcript_3835:20-1942(+)
MEIVDYVIVAVYLLAIVIVGVLPSILARNKLKTIEGFFLGNKKLPWWALGISGLASNFDIAGTAIISSLVFSLGVQGFFVEFRGGVVLSMAIMMVFGKWTRRSNVMTTAEWMKIRFGTGLAGKSARIMNAVSNIFGTILNVTYFAIGSGKFISEFVPFDSWLNIKEQKYRDILSGMAITIFALIYTVISGFQGVVWTDVFQGGLVLCTGLSFCIWALVKMDVPDIIIVSLPGKDSGKFVNRTLSYSTWSTVTPAWDLELPESQYSVFNLLALSMMIYLVRVFLEGTAGPGGYGAQRYLACKSDKETVKMSLFWVILLSLRWPFVAAICVLGLTYNKDVFISDPERVVPVVLDHMTPAGLRGFLVAGFIAAGMSTFDSTINAGAAYYVRDIYQAFINPSASQTTLLIHSRLSSLLMAIVGLAACFLFDNINDVWAFLTVALGTAQFVPVLARWLYWRINGWGFAVGTCGGLVAVIIQRFAFKPIPDYVTFLWNFVISFIFLILGSIFTPATDPKVLYDFYKLTRPPGFWGPQKARLTAETVKAIHKENRRDMLTAFGIAWPFQIFLFLGLMSLIINRFIEFGVLLALFVVFSLLLYFIWWRFIDETVDIDEVFPDDESVLEGEIMTVSTNYVDEEVKLLNQ